MQFTINKTVKVLLTAAMLVTVSLSQVNAASASKTYTEDQFLNSFSGKTKKVISDKLGAPFKKEQSVKPAGATGFLGKVGADEKDSKRVNVEMWYYKNLVKYDPKHAYKETEITFVNDKVMNIAFFNNR
ncbi:hypothetical protein [Methylotenera versatilis]|jgi:hypothetical protein|uniref:Lipoprotein n=1 Tax=Methylotenera versatilis (strain 301) TaxID=666681 RepID=D7DI50_METV0|nr:hypothetical protein [Methylotenera versatilis]ADI29735.1 conserved hypothetical protein [Methylotenera versatilis 301]